MTFVCNFGASITRAHKLELNWANTAGVELQEQTQAGAGNPSQPFYLLLARSAQFIIEPFTLERFNVGTYRAVICP